MVTPAPALGALDPAVGVDAGGNRCARASRLVGDDVGRVAIALVWGQVFLRRVGLDVARLFLSRGAGEGLDHLEEGQRERRGFSRTRLGGCYDVSAGEDGGDCLRLNGGGRGKAEGCDALEYVLV